MLDIFRVMYYTNSSNDHFPYRYSNEKIQKTCHAHIHSF